MNIDLARTVLKAYLARYRPIPYADLAVRIDQSDREEIPQDKVGFWQVQVQFFWDDAPGQNIRVMGFIDDGGPSAYLPLCESFIKAPDGSLVGE